MRAGNFTCNVKERVNSQYLDPKLGMMLHEVPFCVVKFGIFFENDVWNIELADVMQNTHQAHMFGIFSCHPHSERQLLSVMLDPEYVQTSIFIPAFASHG